MAPLAPLAAWIAANAGTIATATSVATAAVGTVASIGQAKTTADNIEQADKFNAGMAKQNAITAGAQANQKEEALRRRVGAIQGAAMAGAAQSGSGLGGSNADIMEQNALNAELDALNIRYEGKQQATGLLAQSSLDSFTAKAKADNFRTEGRVQGATGLLSTASQAYQGYKKVGMYKDW